MNQAATKIGAVYRGRKARREVAKLKADKNQKKKVPQLIKDTSAETPKGPDPIMPAIVDDSIKEPVKEEKYKND